MQHEYRIDAEDSVFQAEKRIGDEEMLLQTATVRSGIIVFMKNDEYTRTADNQPAITISKTPSIHEVEDARPAARADTT